MKKAFILAALLCTPASAQTVNDDTPSTENYWDRVGAGFFSDATLMTPRNEYEIRAHWTGLSDDDRAAVRARCAELQGQPTAAAPSTQEGDKDEEQDTTAAELADGAQTTGENTASTDQTATAPAATGTGSADTATGTGTTVTGSIAGKEVQSSSTSDTAEPYTGLAGASEGDDTRILRVCDLVKNL